MKTLYLARHAKSSWAYPKLRDFERPLKNRGQQNAPKMAAILKERGHIPQLIVSSKAVRALSTARLYAQEWAYPLQDIVEHPDIYDATEQTILSIIHRTNNKHDTMMLVGHNPTFTDLANQLGETTIMNVPTSGIVCIVFDVMNWQEISIGQSAFFLYPKMFL